MTDLEEALAHIHAPPGSATGAAEAQLKFLAAASTRRCAVTGLRQPPPQIIAAVAAHTPGIADGNASTHAEEPAASGRRFELPLRSVRSEPLLCTASNDGEDPRPPDAAEPDSSQGHSDEPHLDLQSSGANVVWPQPCHIVLTGAALLPIARPPVPSALQLGVDLAPKFDSHRAAKGTKGQKAGKGKGSGSKKKKSSAKPNGMGVITPASFDVDNVAGAYCVSAAVLEDRLMARELLAARAQSGQAAVRIEATAGGESVPAARLSNLMTPSGDATSKQAGLSVELQVAAAPLAGQVCRHLLPERLAALVAAMFASAGATEAWKVRRADSWIAPVRRHQCSACWLAPHRTALVSIALQC